MDIGTIDAVQNSQMNKSSEMLNKKKAKDNFKKYGSKVEHLTVGGPI